MYFPYLRGRKYELLALRELVNKDLIGRKVIPIIEPIDPTPTLKKTLDAFIVAEKDIAVIINPTVGDFVKKIKPLRKKEMEDKKDGVASLIIHNINNEQIIRAYIMNNSISKRICKKEDKGKYLIINSKRDCLDAFFDAYESTFPKYTLIPNERVFKKGIKGSKIFFKDNFTKQARNVDYILEQDEFFSDIHLYYKDEGFEGFSDYSIVGEEFAKSGFSPYAVVIHIVYFDNKKELRIRHFVSDSNEDANDPAGKFGEALAKLINWCDKKSITKTEGLKGFYEYHNSGKFPGLGVVKKLSIMHHIELMDKFLEGNL
ncbi:sce7725 family protein [Tissierella sp. Yu-01]|uniref:sce7725 family protein n=1 Tax=Tissierella sp. Yu-01 TaxID=3035694 RepID=UPI00240DBCE6|nr:sce7725 family protein [Tissierella sp. Yu-01]WFA08542.1 sce7725 family protein [Tissierella sp. Yu-01]